MRMTVPDYRIQRTAACHSAVGSITFLAVVLLLALFGAWPAIAQGGEWTTPVIVSTVPGSLEPRYAWFPDIAIDSLGYSHIIWCWTSPTEDYQLLEQVGYTHWNGLGWDAPNDIVPSSPDIVRNAIATDRTGNLHLIFGGSAYNQNFTLYYQQASADDAWSSAAWSQPKQVSHQPSYMGDIAVDAEGVIHVIYDASNSSGIGNEIAFADIFFDNAFC